jgi:hypothetical protein
VALICINEREAEKSQLHCWFSFFYRFIRSCFPQNFCSTPFLPFPTSFSTATFLMTRVAFFSPRKVLFSVVEWTSIRSDCFQPPTKKNLSNFDNVRGKLSRRNVGLQRFELQQRSFSRLHHLEWISDNQNATDVVPDCVPEASQRSGEWEILESLLELSKNLFRWKIQKMLDLEKKSRKTKTLNEFVERI